MWCEHCLTDIATEVSPDGQVLLCTTCGNVVQKVQTSNPLPQPASAREILERWAREQQAARAAQRQAPSEAELQAALSNVLKDSPTPKPTPKVELAPPAPAETAAVEVPKVEVPKESAPVVEQAPPAPIEISESLPQTPGKKWRVDSEHTAPIGPMNPPRERVRRPRHLDKIPVAAAPPEEPTPEPVAEPTPQPEPAAPPMPIRASYRLDEPHSSVPEPHFDIRKAAHPQSQYPGRSETIWGQLLAYGGVGLLTVGTVLVLWGYFGDMESYAPTGWLLATVGQMLLLLGIVTLVAGGMQQTTHEVSQRIEHIDGRIIRIEESTDKILKGPHFKKRRSGQRRSEGATAEKSQDAA